MPDVKHMKWWGWGVEGVAFHHEDKPGVPAVRDRGDRSDVNTAGHGAAVARTTCPSRCPMISDDLAGRAHRAPSAPTT